MLRLDRGARQQVSQTTAHQGRPKGSLLQGVRITKGFGLVTGWVLFLGQEYH
jgi:hypothetical protein